MILLPVFFVLSANPAAMSPEAQARYQQATASIAASHYAEAVATLNALAGENPRVPELFAARCSALLGLKKDSAAEADCTYALTLAPQMAMAVYGLAKAEESQGKRDAAILHYRQYAGMGGVPSSNRSDAQARVAALSSSASAPTPPSPPSVESAKATVAGVGKLVVYRNHLLRTPGRFTLVLDNRLVGDLSMDEYGEIETTPGEHVLETRTSPADAYQQPQVLTRPVELGAAPVYLNYDSRGGEVVVLEMPANQAREEIKSDCKKAFSRHIGADSAEAPRISPPQVIVVSPLAAQFAPQGAVVASGARGCRFSSDCGSSTQYSCRDWRGQQVCMGRGSAGSPCWFSSDCLSNSCEGSLKVCR